MLIPNKKKKSKKVKKKGIVNFVNAFRKYVDNQLSEEEKKEIPNKVIKLLNLLSTNKVIKLLNLLSKGVMVNTKTSKKADTDNIKHTLTAIIEEYIELYGKEGNKTNSNNKIINYKKINEDNLFPKIYRLIGLDEKGEVNEEKAGDAIDYSSMEILYHYLNNKKGKKAVLTPSGSEDAGPEIKNYDGRIVKQLPLKYII